MDKKMRRVVLTAHPRHGAGGGRGRFYLTLKPVSLLPAPLTLSVSQPHSKIVS